MRTLLLAVLVSLPLAAQQPVYDLLLRGGHVIDPKNERDAVMDVAVKDGKIARVAADIAAGQAKTVVDAAGLYVTPGLVDIHVHVAPREIAETENSVPADAFTFRAGVTTVVDAGTSGWKTFERFRREVIETAETRVLAMLNIAASGMGSRAGEDDPDDLDAEAAARIARENPDVIVGFKSAHYAGPGWYSIDRAVEAGKATELPVMVDFGTVTEQRTLDVLLRDKLRPGDIYTHCYSGHRDELLHGKVNPAMDAGRKRGVIFDLGFGAGSFFWYVAVPFFQEGFYPDSISTDIHRHSMNGGMRDMAHTMAKILNLGLSMQEVVRLSTVNPAREIHRPELGNLDVGAEADVAVLRLTKGSYGLLDSAGARYPGDRMLSCELTLRAGKVVWDLNGMASKDWQEFPYKRRDNSR
ncbi:MAG: amidohydrolase/deacetylase family metallohydrolase [Acidobacteria bacterium]|nr:amidohydrolase/deacetylase family metallohydrolase [Acidobacteriota bacterium]